MSNNMPNVVFMGPLYPENEEQQLLAKSKVKASSAPNVFQWHLIRGLEEALGNDLEIINAFPVGTWPGAYADSILPNRTWKNGSVDCHEAGCINLPLEKAQQLYTLLYELLENQGYGKTKERKGEQA